MAVFLLPYLVTIGDGMIELIIAIGCIGVGVGVIIAITLANNA